MRTQQKLQLLHSMSTTLQSNIIANSLEIDHLFPGISISDADAIECLQYLQACCEHQLNTQGTKKDEK